MTDERVMRTPDGVWEVAAIVLRREGRDVPQFRVKRHGYLVGRYPDFPGQRSIEEVRKLMGERAFRRLTTEEES